MEQKGNDDLSAKSGFSDQLAKTPKKTYNDLTIGEFRTRIEFNPGAHGKVDQLKNTGAMLLDLAAAVTLDREIVNPAENGEFARLKAKAMTDIEQGLMWIVKAATF